jgi:hypothetical protein
MIFDFYLGQKIFPQFRMQRGDCCTTSGYLSVLDDDD